MATRTKRTTTTKRARKTAKLDTSSVVPAKFRERYGRSGNCGDKLALKFAQATRVDGKPDPAKVRKLAEANGCWQPGYEKLNAGMQSMNVSNRLRKLARDGAAIKWGR